ncbi:hypothetical protein V5O48_008745 [Marasmius crinis-equi]|uniref:Uncharacterized protein n=1 Tax=Marasmius crinis-equi TaxID=585013 RepID=A0ABR3FD59_9AGAR
MIVGYPPHCTHALQGLDVVCFSVLKTELENAIQKFEETHKHDMRKSDLLGVFSTAFLHLFTEDLVKSAFWVTGLYPFDRAVIKPEQMKPAEVTSIRLSFALTPTSPVKAIMESFRT